MATAIVSYEEALAAGRAVGASKASDASTMALFCESAIQILCGAVSPKLIFEGAQKKGLTAVQLASLAGRDPNTAAELMWA